MIEIIFIVILIIVVTAEAVIIRRKMAQNDKYEDVLRTYENWIEQFALTVEAVDGEIDRIDAEGTFRSDDEVGYFFQAIYSILKRLSKYGLTNEPEVIPGMDKDEQGENIFYASEKERYKRIKRVRQDDVSIENIQKIANDKKQQ